MKKAIAATGALLLALSVSGTALANHGPGNSHHPPGQHPHNNGMHASHQAHVHHGK
jgi:hypothetical protein